MQNDFIYFLSMKQCLKNFHAIRNCLLLDQRITPNSSESPLKSLQNKPNIYKMDGQDKLRIIKNMPDAKARADVVEDCLDLLSSKKAA